jgi:hypothetical protein
MSQQTPGLTRRFDFTINVQSGHDKTNSRKDGMGFGMSAPQLPALQFTIRFHTLSHLIIFDTFYKFYTSSFFLRVVFQSL